MKIKFQGQPVEILTLLLARPGEVVTREEFQKKLWQAETFVDFERSLNAAMKRLRAALGESADNPVYVETLARRGYRFVAPVERVRAVMPTPQRAVSRRGSLPWLAAGAGVIAVVLASGLWPIDVPQVGRVVPLTNDATLKVGIGRLISDGNRVLYGDGNDVWSVPASGGEAERLSLGFLQHMKVLADYSPIRQQILLASPYTGKSGANELWLAGTQGEAPHKIAELQPPCRGALGT